MRTETISDLYTVLIGSEAISKQRKEEREGHFQWNNLFSFQTGCSYNNAVNQANENLFNNAELIIFWDRRTKNQYISYWLINWSTYFTVPDYEF